MHYELLQISIQPVEESSLPQDSVLCLENPVVFIWEVKELCWYAAHNRCVIGLHSLREADSVVHAAVDDHDRCSPFVDEFMW